METYGAIEAVIYLVQPAMLLAYTAAEWAVSVGSESLSVLPRGGGDTLDARGGVVERATIHERDLSQHLRWDALS